MVILCFYICVHVLDMLGFVFILTINCILLIRAKKKSQLHHLGFKVVKGKKTMKVQGVFTFGYKCATGRKLFTRATHSLYAISLRVSLRQCSENTSL